MQDRSDEPRLPPRSSPRRSAWAAVRAKRAARVQMEASASPPARNCPSPGPPARRHPGPHTEPEGPPRRRSFRLRGTAKFVQVLITARRCALWGGFSHSAHSSKPTVHGAPLCARHWTTRKCAVSHICSSAQAGVAGHQAAANHHQPSLQVPGRAVLFLIAVSEMQAPILSC